MIKIYLFIIFFLSIIFILYLVDRRKLTLSNFDMITRPLSFTTCHLTNANIAPRLLPTTAPTSNVLNGTKDAYM